MIADVCIVVMAFAFGVMFQTLRADDRARERDRAKLVRARRVVDELLEEAAQWREDHPTGDDDEVDYASGLLSAADDIRSAIGEG